MKTNRRRFLQGGLAAGASATLGATASAASRGSAAPSDPVLVLVQAAGGYDLFNMLVPDEPVYREARPTIGIAPSATLGEVEPGTGIHWHPALAPLKELYDAGRAAVVQNVGYPQPNLSHFSSRKVWAAGTRAIPSSRGWLGTYLSEAYTGGSPLPALDLSGERNPAFGSVPVPVMRSVTDYGFRYDRASQHDNALEALLVRTGAQWPRPGASAELQGIAGELLGAIDDSKILTFLGADYAPRVAYPDSRLARSLQLAARYVTAGSNTRIYQTRATGFDHHANLANGSASTTGALADRLADLFGSLKAFLDDLEAHDAHRRVLVLVWSEFSRRLGENGSSGTDHGHATVSFLLGEGVRGGLYGSYPDLRRATRPYADWYPTFGDDSIDFRRIYATVLERWLGVPDHAAVLGERFPLLSALG